jgi:glycosyltransferase involved in cell wall biosynthesis
MRVIILADPLDNQKAGIYTYTRMLVSSLAKTDNQDEYFILRRRRDKTFPSERQIVVRNFRFPGYAALRMFLIIPFIIRRLKPDIVVEPAHFGPFNLPRRIRRVTVIHDLTPVLFPRFHRLHSQLLQRIFLRPILRRASMVITNSRHTSKDVAEYCPGVAAKTRHIYLGIDKNLAEAGKDASIEHITGGRRYFLFTGTIEPRKNLVSLLEAYRIYREMSLRDDLLVIAGGKGWKSGAFFNKLKQHAFRHDIIMAGYVDRGTLGALYRHALALVYPSLYEGFGLPVAEAMSCGTPCLLSSNSSLPEVGGEAALYFDPLEPEDIADSMNRIASDIKLRGSLGEKATGQAGRFSWDLYVEEFDNELRKLLVS